MISKALARNSLSSMSLLDRERLRASQMTFSPRGTVRCRGTPAFRSQAARDAACLFDTDKSVIEWVCMPEVFSRQNDRHIPDFLVERSSCLTLVDVTSAVGSVPPLWMPEAARETGYRYEAIPEATFRKNHRFINSREMLRYASHDVSLGDRVRLLAFLDEHGPAPLAACLPTIRNGRDAVGVLAALALRRVIDIEIDDALLGPDTLVSRFRD